MLRSALDKLRLFKHFFSSARRRGLLRTIQISLYEVWFERKIGVTTGLVIPVARLDYDEEAKEHAEPYFPSSYLFLQEALAAGPLDCTGHVFVDYGCGMGRALLFASTLPFKRIIGVELSRSLCRAATKNMNSYYHKQQKTTPEWAIANVDARVFQIPDDATIFYMANPFDDTVVGKVFDNIVASIHATPRRCYIVYANPIHEQLLIQRNFKKISRPTTDYVIYTSE